MATLIAQAGAFVSAVIYLNRTHELIRFTFRKIQFDRVIFKQNMRIGFPIGFQQAFVALSMMVMYWLVNPFGTDTAAAYSVVFRIDAFAAMPAMNFAAALAAFVGQNLGALKPDRAEKSVWKTGKYNAYFMGLVSIFYIVFAPNLLALFSNESDVIEYGSLCLRIIAAGYIFYAYGMVVIQSFNGAGDTKTPTIINFFCFWIIQLPFAYVFAIKLDFGPIGVFWAITLAEVLIAIIAVILFKKGKWKLVKV